MAAAAAQLRVIMCGQSSQIANSVKAGLHPEFEVIHIILNAAAGARDIPLLLSGRTPPAEAEPNMGTRDYSKKADVVVAGGGYDDEKFNEMRNACAELEGKGGVPWLRVNRDIPAPPLGPEYGKAIVERCKASLRGLEPEGKLGKDGVYFF